VKGDPPPGACGHHERLLGGVRCLVTGSLEEADAPRPVVIYCHGGGYALGSPEVAVPITERLARGCSIVSVDYRLAPEHPYPAAIEDAEAVDRAVRTTMPNRPVVLAGDSAGANIALSVALRGRRLGQSLTGLLLLSPHVDHAADRRSSFGDRTTDVDAGAAEWLTAAYCGEVPRDDPRVSPLRADLTGLPPTLIQVGTIDSALTQAIRLARRARVAGVDVSLDIWDGLWHTWHYHRELPEAARALSEASQFVTKISETGR
ncbi:MAG: alpha/beta hydrolase, partial [Acidimicrobiia bacterium]|nr:alpha/beta hydrolase [Acidimicrobiia bacterium]